MNDIFDVHILDASALAKLFIDETKSDVLEDYFWHKGKNFYTTSLCLGETLGLFKARILGKDKQKYIETCKEFLGYISGEIIKVENVPIDTKEVYDKAENFVVKYNIDIVDASQIVIIQKLSASKTTEGFSPILITADKDLAIAAKDQKLSVWDVCNYPPPI